MTDTIIMPVTTAAQVMVLAKLLCLRMYPPPESPEKPEVGGENVVRINEDQQEEGGDHESE